MSEEYVEELIQKYAEGTASKEEILQLMKWYSAAEINEVKWPATKPGEDQEVYNRMLHRLQQDMSLKRTRVFNFSWLKVAAVLLVIIGLGFIILQVAKPFSNPYITVVFTIVSIQLIIFEFLFNY